MKKNSVQFLARTALLLALCVVVQLVITGQWVKGPLVNVVLLVAAMSGGPVCGLIVAVLNPLLVFLIAPPAIMLACPPIMVSVMLGNSVLVLVAWLLREKWMGLVGLVAAAVLKAAAMAAAISWVIIPVFGGALNEKQVAMATKMFGITQLYTAAIGCAVFFAVWQVLKKVPGIGEKKA
ncbi:MAG: ECF transporter S component [Faecalibacterium sp.]|nr:ECF transporter S component [Faecalibacterium sp.]